MESLPLISIPRSIEPGERFIKPNWPAIADWIEENIPSEKLNQCWNHLARQWLEMLREALGNSYVIVESQEFVLVAKNDSRLSNRLLASCEHARRTILQALPAVARDGGYGKHVVLAFADTESYYDYISDYDPEEGEFALSGGVFIDQGYGHFAICLAYGNDHERVIAHELNHDLLRHLPLPLWLNEGVTQVMEDLVVGSSHFSTDRDIVRRHRAYWTPIMIDTFWSGNSFSSPDEGQELSYHLAQVLFRNLMSDYPKQISAILNAAHYADAGNAALRQLCGVSLGDRVYQFLGEGDWEPGRSYPGID